MRIISMFCSRLHRRIGRVSWEHQPPIGRLSIPAASSGVSAPAPSPETLPPSPESIPFFDPPEVGAITLRALWAKPMSSHEKIQVSTSFSVVPFLLSVRLLAWFGVFFLISCVSSIVVADWHQVYTHI